MRRLACLAYLACLACLLALISSAVSPLHVSRKRVGGAQILRWFWAGNSLKRQSNHLTAPGCLEITSAQTRAGQEGVNGGGLVSHAAGYQPSAPRPSPPCLPFRSR